MSLLFFLTPVLLCAQTEIPRDTSYTIYSTLLKLKEEYPFITPVMVQRAEGVRTKADIVYASHRSRNLHLDIFRPDDSISRPAVLMIHGGGWRSGNKEMEHAMAAHLAGKGYVAVPVEYRLSPEALYPAAVHDLKAAIRWVRSHADEYNIDPKRIAVYGSSAGGTLAALVGTTGDVDDGDPAISSSVHAIIDVDGVLDFTHPAESGKDTGTAPLSAGASFFGATYKEKPELWREGSPVNYVSSRTPSVLFINSSVERFHAGRDEMIEKLNWHGVYSEVHIIPGTPHSFWLFHPWFEQTAEYVLKFLRSRFEGGK